MNGIELRDTTQLQTLQQKGTAILTINGLSKWFGTKQVLKNVNLELHKAENLVILGKSGSGKSVLLKCIIGLLQPDSGTVEVFGHDVTALSYSDLNRTRLRIGFLFQSAALYDSMTVRENLSFPLRYHHKEMKAAAIEQAVKLSLQNVGLENSIDALPSNLSGGMRKRIGLARTLIMKPDILLYDEPTTGLDAITSREISQLIVGLQKTNNISAIIITHDMACAKITANRIGVLKEGKIVAEGDYAALEKAADPWVRSFFE